MFQRITYFIFYLVMLCGHIASVAQNKAIDTVLQNTWIARGEAIILSNTDSAMILLQQVAALSEKNLNSKPSVAFRTAYLKNQSVALNDIGYIYNNKGDYQKAIDYFIKSLKIDEGFGDELGVASSLNNISNIYFAQGNVTSALAYMNKSLYLYKKFNKEEGMADAYNSLGYYYDFLGDLKMAVDYYHKSIKLYEKNNIQNAVAKVLNNLGSISNRVGDPEKALEYYTKSLNIKQKANDKKGIALSLNNIGKIYSQKGDYEKALEYYHKSYLISQDIGNKSVSGIVLNNIGRIYILKNNTDSAKKYLTASLNIRQTIGDKEGESSSLQSLSIIYMKENKTGLAKETAEQSYKISKELGFPDGMSSAALLLKDIYLKLKLYNKAFEYQEIYYKMKDSISNIETKKAGLKSQYKYEYEKQATTDSIAHAKEADIKNAILDKQQAELKAKRNQQYALYIGIVLVLVFAGFMFNRFKVTQKQKQIIEIKERETQEQKHLIEEKHKEITDSINYAERIQRSFLATKELLDENLKNYFVFFKPKDIVSGDFYWAHRLKNGNFALVTADSTGHGVPGAIMSLLNTTSLVSVIKDGYTKPSDILNHTRQTIIECLQKDGSAEGGKDGMDCSLICFDFKNSKFTYAAANNPIWIIRENKLIELASDKMPVGKHERDSISFIQHEVAIEKGDMVYTLTDGFPDQFGGLKGKKFMYKKLKETLLSISNLPVNEQHDFLKSMLKEWMGNIEQVDDITIIGIRV